jgi:3D (Asp-Asp-Asp) domain-containing protein
LGVSQGAGFRLKGLFAFGVVILALGYVVPTVGVASGPVGPVASGLAAHLDAFTTPARPRPLRTREEARVYDGRLVTFSEQLRSATAPIPFLTRQVSDPSLLAGIAVVDAAGADGAVQQVFDESLVDGAVVDSELLSSSTTPASDRVVRVGTGAAPQPDLSGAPLAYAEALAGSSTAYCDLGHTATGSQAGPGSIAVDPTLIPLGSHLYIPGYGYGWAVDTGGAIRGPIVDVWLSCPAAIQWGRRRLTIYVLAS